MLASASLYSFVKAVARGPGVEVVGAGGGGEGEGGVAEGIVREGTGGTVGELGW